MTAKHVVDITHIPELASRIAEAEHHGDLLALQRDGRTVAILLPVPGVHAGKTDGQSSAYSSVVAATAGSFKYDGPRLTIEEEKDAFVQGVADEVMESMNDNDRG